MRIRQRAMAEADGAGAGGGTGTGTGGGTGAASSSSSSSSKPSITVRGYNQAVGDLAKTQAELERVKAESGSTAAALKKAQEDATKAAELVAKYQKRDADAADAIFKTLPEPQQKKLELLKPKFSDPAEWLAYVTAEKGEGVDPPPPGDTTIQRGTDGGPRSLPKYKVQNPEFVEEVSGREIKYLPEMNFESNASERKWFPPMTKFFQMMRKDHGQVIKPLSKGGKT